MSTNATISDVGRQYLRMQQVPDVGPIRLRRLVQHFGTLDPLFAASRAELCRANGVGEKIADSLFRALRDDATLAKVDKEIATAADLGIRILCWEDPQYPRPLLHTDDPPICLYVRGQLEPADAVAVAIVGTRRCSTYGREQARRFAGALARTGFTVVSGLARGVDGLAHQGALEAGGRTLAVLGNGLPEIYPPEHEELAARIAEAGAVISESPLHAAPEASTFPRRNRILAGLSLGVLVIEAGKGSGALITARLAGEYNREVFALPGRIDQPALTAGVNGLIRDGAAKLVTCLDDLLDDLSEVGRIMRREVVSPKTDDGLFSESTAAGNDDPDAGRDDLRATGLAEPEQLILKAVIDGSETIDDLCAASGLEAGRVLAALTALQMRGLVQAQPGNRYVKRS